MRKLVISAFALAAMTSFAMAAEPVKLTSSQLDQVAAGNPCSFAFKSVATCIQSNWTTQTAVAVGGGKFSSTSAANLNSTTQVMGDKNF
jgi:hypothetical protein